jgi:hypothetical protein
MSELFRTKIGCVAFAVCLGGAFAGGGLVSSASAKARQPKTPVTVGAGSEEDACSAVSEVVGLSSGKSGFLSVRSSPTTSSAELDRLYNGLQVQECTPKNDFVGIVYDKTGKLDCGVSSPLEAQKYRGPCRSGWVARKYLKIIAG